MAKIRALNPPLEVSPTASENSSILPRFVIMTQLRNLKRSLPLAAQSRAQDSRPHQREATMSDTELARLAKKTLYRLLLDLDEDDPIWEIARRTMNRFETLEFPQHN